MRRLHFRPDVRRNANHDMFGHNRSTPKTSSISKSARMPVTRARLPMNPAKRPGRSSRHSPPPSTLSTGWGEWLGSDTKVWRDRAKFALNEASADCPRSFVQLMCGMPNTLRSSLTTAEAALLDAESFLKAALEILDHAGRNDVGAHVDMALTKLRGHSHTLPGPT